MQKIKIVQNEYGQNTYIIEFNGYCVVVDAGTELATIKKYTIKPIKAVLITHGHFDHIKNIEEYDKENIQIYASKYITELLNDEYKNASVLFGFEKVFKLKNLKFVEENEEIIFENHIIKCLQTQGHSVDSMCYLLDNETLFSGDTVFAEGVGRTDLPTGNTKQIVQSLNKILSLDYKTLFSGHGRPSEKQEQKTNIPKFINYLN